MPAELEFRRVECVGTFDHSQQILMGPRSAPAGMAAVNGQRVSAGVPTSSGWDVITPLRCTDGSLVLVNRGWVPRDQVDALTHPQGEQRVHGVLRAGEAGNRFAQNDVARRRFVWLDVEALADATGASRIVVYQTGGASSLGSWNAPKWRGTPTPISPTNIKLSWWGAPHVGSVCGLTRPSRDHSDSSRWARAYRRRCDAVWITPALRALRSLLGSAPVPRQRRPAHRPLDSLVQFYVEPSTHLVRGRYTTSRW